MDRRRDTYEGRPLANPDEDIFDQGLAFDLDTLFDRRRILKLFGVTGVAAGLGPGRLRIVDRWVRRAPLGNSFQWSGDRIRSSFGEFSGVADGVPLTIRLTIQSTSDGCAPLAGAAVYLWQCSRDGNYSIYTVADQNYLRGVQEADEDGVVTFTSIYPGCYSGRWPHIHFRGLRRSLGGDRRRQQDRHVADRAARGTERHRVRDGGP